jgi:predicted nucleic acid-binding protein
MTVVLDVSGAVEILFKKEKADKFKKLMIEATWRVTPDLYIHELTNTLWKYFSKKIYTKAESIQYIQDGIDFISNFIDSKDIWLEAFAAGIDNKHSIYDMFYMITARRNNGILITNDSDLAAVCRKNRVQVCY